MGREMLASRTGAGHTGDAHTGDVLTGAARAGLLSEAGPGVAFAPESLLPVRGDLASLLPGGGLRRGSTVLFGKSGYPGATSLTLALLSGPMSAGSWCAVLGAPELGMIAAAQLGVDLERLALVPKPGDKWLSVAAALFEGFDLVLVRIPGPTVSAEARRLEARARERRSVLIVLGDGWPARADVRLEVVGSRWLGLGQGHGYLAGYEIDVLASGKGAASRPRRAKVVLGGIGTVENVVNRPSPISDALERGAAG